MTVPVSDGALSTPFGWQFVTPLMCGSALNPINTSMIATALVGIGSDLKVGTGPTAALISVLYLSSAVSQPTLGKVSTLVGPRRTFLCGLIILFAGGVLGAAAPTFGVLLVSRSLIGIGTSACYPTAMSLIRQRADATGTGVPTSVLGNLAIAAQITLTFGFPLGGVLVGVFGWRAIFMVNVPLAAITFALTVAGIPRDSAKPRDDWRQVIAALDIPGILLFAAAITSLLLFFADLRSPVWSLAAMFVVLAAGLFFWERRADRPLIDVRMLWHNRPLQRTYLRTGLVNLANYTALLGVTQWMEQAKGLSASTSGLILVPLSGCAVIISRVVSRRGWIRYPLIFCGAAQSGAGIALLTINRDAGIVPLVAITVLLSSYAFGAIGNQAALYVQSPAKDIAVAAGLFRTSIYVGAIFSSSLIAIAFGSKATDAGLHSLAGDLMAIGAAMMILTVFDRRIPTSAYDAGADPSLVTDESPLVPGTSRVPNTDASRTGGRRSR